MRFVVSCLMFGAMAALSVQALAQQPAAPWNMVQTHGMLPLDPEEAAAKGWTVNGLWAGFSMPEAVRSVSHAISREGAPPYPVEWTYPTMRDYVEANHKAGLLVPASLMGIAGHPLQRARFPEMEQGGLRWR